MIPCKLQPDRKSAFSALIAQWQVSISSRISCYCPVLLDQMMPGILASAIVNQLFSCPTLIAQWQVLISPQISCSCPPGTVQLMQGILQPTRKSAIFLSGVDYPLASTRRLLLSWGRSVSGCQALQPVCPSADLIWHCTVLGGS